MIKAIVVDDERLVRKGFISLIDWSSHGIVIAGEAGDGKSALELLKRSEVDLAFVDITMPGISGFDLIQQIRQQYPHIYSVVLTCHHEFDYVQEALRVGAIDYIVKTLMEMENVEDVIRRIVERVKWEESSRMVYRAVKREKRFPACDALLFRSYSETESNSELYQIPIVQRNSLMEFDGFWLMPLVQAASEEELSRELSGHLNPDWQTALLADLEGRLLEEINEAVHGALEEHLFYSTEANRLIRIRYDELTVRETSRKRKLDPMAYDLKWTLHAREWDELTQWVQEERPAPDGFPAFGEWLCRQWGSLLMREEAESLAADMLQNLKWPDWKIWLRRFSDGVKGRMIDLCLSREVMHCLIKAMAFMRANIGGKINQKEVAQHVNMSRSYFSQCFAKFAGESFGEHLRNMRIDHAKSLLLESDRPVYEIAYSSGFEDEKYFSRIFRERVGQSPSNFRTGSGAN